MTTAYLPHGVRVKIPASMSTRLIQLRTALIFFEYLFTLDQEVKLFWGKKLTGPIALFLANRYTTLCYTMYYMLIGLVPAAYQTAEVCMRVTTSLSLFGTELTASHRGD